jgi:integrase/recombinase XerD
MSRGGDNLYRRGNGTWYARVQVRGRDIRRSLRTASRPEAVKRLKAILEQAEHIRFHGEARHTWNEAVVEWAKAAAADTKPSTIKRYVVSLRQVRRIMDGLYVDEITPRVISRIARRGGVSNATRRRDLTAVSVVLRWCAGHGWREDNPARTWDRGILRERRDPTALPHEADIDRVIAAAPGNFARMIRFAQYTGMRLEEVASLRRSQIRGDTVQLTNTKNGRARAVPLDDRAAGTLAGTPPYFGSANIFWHDQGERYRNVSSRFRVIVKRSGARPFRFHDLRHWYAVDYLRRGGSIYTLSQILGHSSVKVTEIYLRYVTPEEAERSKAAG